MLWFTNSAIKWKIFSSFAVIIVCLAVVIISAISTMDNMRHDIATALEARGLRNSSNSMRQEMLEALLDNPQSPDYVTKQTRHLDTIAEITNHMKTSIGRLHQEFKMDPQGLALLDTLSSTFDQYVSYRDDKEIPLLRSGRVQDAVNNATGEQERNFQTLKDDCGMLSDHIQGQAESRAEKARYICIGTGIGAIGIACFLSWLLNRLIAIPLGEITHAANRLSVGDLEVQLVPSVASDEVGSLSQSFSSLGRSWKEMSRVASQVASGDLTARIPQRSGKDAFVITFNQMVQMIQEMSQMTAQFREAATVVSQSSAQILAAVSQSAVGATQTATAATETATIVEEVRQTSHVANDKARQVSDSAQKTAQMTTMGRHATQGLIDGMNSIRGQVDLIADAMVRLSDKTQSITGIIKSVDELSKQSNRLAVNAYIEAARAGDAGKGFSVVAQEVRNLSEQSKQATNQIRSLLMEIQIGTNAATMATELGGRVVDAALQQSSQANETISFLATSVIESAQAASQIAISSQQQLTGVDEVATAMNGIGDACSEQLKAIRQVESAAHRLNDIGQTLNELSLIYQNWEATRDGTHMSIR